MAWAAGAWVVVARAAVAREAEALVDPEQAVAAERTCGNPAEAVAVQAAVDWALVGSGPALVVAGRARAVVAEQEVAEE